MGTEHSLPSGAWAYARVAPMWHAWAHRTCWHTLVSCDDMLIPFAGSKNASGPAAALMNEVEEASSEDESASEKEKDRRPKNFFVKNAPKVITPQAGPDWKAQSPKRTRASRTGAALSAKQRAQMSAATEETDTDTENSPVSRPRASTTVPTSLSKTRDTESESAKKERFLAQVKTMGTKTASRRKYADNEASDDDSERQVPMPADENGASEPRSDSHDF